MSIILFLKHNDTYEAYNPFSCRATQRTHTKLSSKAKKTNWNIYWNVPLDKKSWYDTKMLYSYNRLNVGLVWQIGHFNYIIWKVLATLNRGHEATVLHWHFVYKKVKICINNHQQQSKGQWPSQSPGNMHIFLTSNQQTNILVKMQILAHLRCYSTQFSPSSHDSDLGPLLEKIQ